MNYIRYGKNKVGIIIYLKYIVYILNMSDNKYEKKFEKLKNDYIKKSKEYHEIKHLMYFPISEVKICFLYHTQNSFTIHNLMFYIMQTKAYL